VVEQTLSEEFQDGRPTQGGRRTVPGTEPTGGRSATTTAGHVAAAQGAASPAERLLSPAEVAEQFGVDVRTVARWEHDGRLTAIRTLGGHRRYVRSEVVALLALRAQKDLR
jgi:excisionase family DNA binding protein